MRLLPEGTGWVHGGRIMFQGTDILALGEERMRALRGAEVAMIFQDSLSSLNPVMRVGDQVVEAILAHERVSRGKASGRAETLLKHVGIPSPREAMARYPHELSGGMRQRVMIAIAVALQPKLIIADEPTTALDPTIHAQVLELLKRLTREMGAALILITHDFGVIAEMADEVIVMYAGRIVEQAAADGLFANPRHPYTIGLLHSLPSFDVAAEELVPIEGAPPILSSSILGCPFAPRCSRRIATCKDVTPSLSLERGESHEHVVACHNPPAKAEADRAGVQG
jgi:oligopeptide/dipeptide ABC transporter ATP-binding protein